MGPKAPAKGAIPRLGPLLFYSLKQLIKKGFLRLFIQQFLEGPDGDFHVQKAILNWIVA